MMNVIDLNRAATKSQFTSVSESGGTVTDSSFTTPLGSPYYANTYPALLLNATSGVVSATKDISVSSSPFVFEAIVMPNGTATGIIELLDSSGNVLITMNINGASSAHVAFSTNSVGATSAVWASSFSGMVVLHVNPNAHTVTGLASYDWGHIQITTLGTKGYTGTVAKWRVKTGSATGIFYITNVRIYYPDVVMVGDSLTGGIPWWREQAPAYNTALADETKIVPYKLGNFLDSFVANRGIPGTTIAATAYSLWSDWLEPHVLSMHPGKVVLSLGINDLMSIYNTPLATMMSDYSALIDQMTASGITAGNIVVASLAPSADIMSSRNTDRLNFNSWLQTTAASNGYLFVDYANTLKDPGDQNALLSSYNQDGTHLTNAGYTAEATALYAVLMSDPIPVWRTLPFKARKSDGSWVLCPLKKYYGDSWVTILEKGLKV